MAEYHMWYDRHGRPIGRDEAIRLFGDSDARRIAHDPLVIDGEPVWLSTVYLVFNHQWGDGPPLIFETMVFGGKDSGMCWRWPTEEAALAGHDRALAELQATGAVRG